MSHYRCLWNYPDSCYPEMIFWTEGHLNSGLHQKDSMEEKDAVRVSKGKENILKHTKATCLWFKVNFRLTGYTIFPSRFGGGVGVKFKFGFKINCFFVVVVF